MTYECPHCGGTQYQEWIEPNFFGDYRECGTCASCGWQWVTGLLQRAA